MNTTNYIFLNTADSADTSTHDASFALNLKNLDSNHSHFSLDGLSFANCVYPINTNYNTLIYEENDAGSTTTTTITPKNYTGAQLATELQTQMNNDTQETTTYTVSYDTQTKKLTFAGTNNFRILSSSTCLREIGFEEMTTAATSKVSDYPVRLDGTQYVDIRSNLSNRNINSNKRTNTMARVYLTASFGEIQTYKNQDNSFVRINPELMTSIKLKLSDDRGNEFLLPNNCEVSYTFKLF